MNRRNFLTLTAGALAAAALPLKSLGKPTYKDPFLTDPQFFDISLVKKGGEPVRIPKNILMVGANRPVSISEATLAMKHGRVFEYCLCPREAFVTADLIVMSLHGVADVTGTKPGSIGMVVKDRYWSYASDSGSATVTTLTELQRLMKELGGKWDETWELGRHTHTYELEGRVEHRPGSVHTCWRRWTRV